MFFSISKRQKGIVLLASLVLLAFLPLQETVFDRINENLHEPPAPIYEPSTPIQAKVSIDQYPPVGVQTTITCEISSAYDAPGTTAQMELPENTQVIDGSIDWQGDLLAGNPEMLSVSVVFSTPAEVSIFCRVFRPVDENEVWGDLAALYFTVGMDNQNSFKGWAPIERENYAAAVELSEVGDDGQLHTTTYDAMAMSPFGPRNSEPPAVTEPSIEGENLVDPNEELLTAGLLTVTGKWSYYDRDGVKVGARKMLVELVRGSDNAHLAWDYTDDNGYYEFDPVTNPGSAGVRTVLHSYTNYAPYYDKLVVVNPAWGTSTSMRTHTLFELI